MVGIRECMQKGSWQKGKCVESVEGKGLATLAHNALALCGTSL